MQKAEWQRCECLARGLTSTEVTSEVTDLECTMVRGSLRAWRRHDTETE